MNRSRTIILSALAASAAFATLATADTVDVYATGLGAGMNVSTILNGNVRNGFAGQINLSLSNSVGNNVDGSWIAYCTELDQHIFVPGNAGTYSQTSVASLPDPGPAMGAARADAIARMYFAAGGAQFGADNEFCAAFQVAIWEVANDFGGSVGLGDLSGGAFTASGLTANMQSYLSALFAAASGNGSQALLLGLGSGTNQDQIIQLPSPGALALMGAAGLVNLRRRRR